MEPAESETWQCKIHAGYILDQALQRLRLVYTSIGDLVMPYNSSSHPYPHINVGSATVAESSSSDMLSDLKVSLTAGPLSVLRKWICSQTNVTIERGDVGTLLWPNVDGN